MRPEVAAQDQAVFSGKHEIENDQVDLVTSDVLPHLLAVTGKQYVVLPLSKIFMQQLSQFSIVVNNEYRFFHVKSSDY